MEDRKFIHLYRLHKRIKTADTNGDWVTIGIIVAKSEPKMSSNVRVTMNMHTTTLLILVIAKSECGKLSRKLF